MHSRYGDCGSGVVNSNVFSVGSDFSSNGTSNALIAYCFASKRGVSKVGNYIGTGAVGSKGSLNNTLRELPGQDSCDIPSLIYCEYIVSPIKD